MMLAKEKKISSLPNRCPPEKPHPLLFQPYSTYLETDKASRIGCLDEYVRKPFTDR
jgi:hypothetical protein